MTHDQEMQYVAAERVEQLRQLSAEDREDLSGWTDVANAQVPDPKPISERGRLVEYETGVESMGYRETWSTFLCWECDEDAWRDGWCHEHWYAKQAQDELEALEEWTEEAYAAEELARAQQEAQEARDDA